MIIDLFFYAHGVDEKNAEKLKVFLLSLGKPIVFFCDETDNAILAYTGLDINEPATALACLNHAPDSFETFDCYKNQLESSDNKVPVVITSAAFINKYLGLQYEKHPNARPGDVIACDGYFLPFWTGEHEKF